MLNSKNLKSETNLQNTLDFTEGETLTGKITTQLHLENLECFTAEKVSNRQERPELNLITKHHTEESGWAGAVTPARRRRANQGILQPQLAYFGGLEEGESS